MGALDGQEGQPVVVSAWAPAWWSKQFDCTLELGPADAQLLDGLCWAVTLREIPRHWLRKNREKGSYVTRLKVGRQFADTDLKAWYRQRLQESS
jgi:ABC-type proline/glycine betaine transport system substrate-binding protein